MAEVCAGVIDAARDLRDRMEAFNRQREASGEPWLMSRLAVHIGEVLYGNIGALDRLDFTMVGPAVNEPSRMEELCKTLDVDSLFSEGFHAACRDGERLEMVGCFSLRGVDGQREMYTLKLERRCASADRSYLLASAPRSGRGPLHPHAGRASGTR